jgi:hypothetical protein
MPKQCFKASIVLLKLKIKNIQKNCFELQFKSLKNKKLTSTTLQLVNKKDKIEMKIESI